MNIKRFIKVFLIAIAVIIAVFCGTVAATMLSLDKEISLELDNLDEYEKDGRRNILILGTDKSGLRSDVIMILSFSTKDKTIHSISIPRDTGVKINGRMQKINSALTIGGEELVVDVVREATGIPVHECVKVNFDAVSDIVDALGGVEFNVPQDMKYSDPVQNLEIDLKEGEQVLDGDEALQLLRFRSYPMADLQRIQVQQDFIKEAVEQKAKFKYIFKIGDICSAVEDNVESTMSVADVAKLVLSAKIKGMDSIKSYEMPVSTSASAYYVTIDQAEMEKLANKKFK